MTHDTLFEVFSNMISLILFDLLYPDSESIQNVQYTFCEIKARVYFISKFY